MPEKGGKGQGEGLAALGEALPFKGGTALAQEAVRRSVEFSERLNDTLRGQAAVAAATWRAVARAADRMADELEGFSNSRLGADSELVKALAQAASPLEVASAQAAYLRGLAESYAEETRRLAGLVPDLLRQATQPLQDRASALAEKLLGR